MIKIIKHMGRLVPCENNPKILCVCKQHKQECKEEAQKAVEDETSL